MPPAHFYRRLAAGVMVFAATIGTGSSVFGACDGCIPAEEALRSATYMPRVKRPHAVGQLNISAVGVFVLRVHRASGRVEHVDVARSTDWWFLDAAAVKVLKQWRFKPRALPSIKKLSPAHKDGFANDYALIEIPIRID